MIILLQRRIQHEPDQWEDLRIPESTLDAKAVAQTFADLKEEGTYRVVEDKGVGSTPIMRTFNVYRKEVFEFRLDWDLANV